MFERFTQPARKVVVLSQVEARHFDHSYIGVEHLLLGLLRVDKEIASEALSSLNVTLDKVREQVESIIGYGEKVAEGNQLPFTPACKKVLELALREALQLGHNYIGTEHLLLGLVRESEGAAARILRNLAVDSDEVRKEVVRCLARRTPRKPATAARRRRPKTTVDVEREQSEIPRGFDLQHTIDSDVDDIRQIVWSPDGGLLALLSHDGLIEI